MASYSMGEYTPKESTMDLSRIYQSLEVHGKTYRYVSLPAFQAEYFMGLKKFPLSLKVLLEGIIRNINGKEITLEHLRDFMDYKPGKPGDVEMPYLPARVLLQDFTGVPCVVDLAAMRSAVERMGKDPSLINPKLPVDLVIDHSVNTDFFGSNDAFKKNVELEYHRNMERYELLRWAQGAFRNFSVVPPASGICHQVNLEYLASVVQQGEDGTSLYFDTLVGTDSHTTMINGLGVLGWGVGGIEAEAAMLGQPVYMLVPPVVGVRIEGKLKPGVTSTDAVLSLTQMLRKHGVVNKIVEFFGPGISTMSVPDRATLANMAPEYGATAGYFPIDKRTIEYLEQTGRDEQQIRIVEAYAKAQGVFWTETMEEPEFEDILSFDLSMVQAAMAGPKRPQDRIVLGSIASEFNAAMSTSLDKRGFAIPADEAGKSVRIQTPSGKEAEISHGSVVIASITSCTNTSSPSLMIAAGLLARNAIKKGILTKPWVKTSFAPGSVVVTDYLVKAGLMPFLEELGFNLVGYGCMTCIGNSGNLPDGVIKGIEEGKLVAAAVLSGNRNFEGRVNPHTKANYLASPPLCVAYALAGSVRINLESDALGLGSDGKPVFLADIWPQQDELDAYVAKALDRETFKAAYQGIETSNEAWNALTVTKNKTYNWEASSTYIQEPPFFKDLGQAGPVLKGIVDARCLAKFGDSITTDHISPAGNISPKSPAGIFLQEKGVPRDDFNSYGSRRGNDLVMTRGTFANIRLRNLLVPGTEGGVSKHFPSGQIESIFDVASRYQAESVASIIIAGKDYGMGSSRDWAAKGVKLLGVQAVIAESYERIHRSNLVGMGVLPLQFLTGENAESLGIQGDETFTIELGSTITPKSLLTVKARRANGENFEFRTMIRLDSSVDIDYYQQGGILQTVLRNMLG